MFDNPILDWFSKIHWSAPLIVWVPVFLFCLYSAIRHDLGLMIIPFFFAGLIIWTLSEYVLHRFIFHYHPTSSFGQKIHFVMHGVHHDYPNDSKRLVMPPVLSILISIPFALGFWFGFGQNGSSFAAFAGMIFGYLSYDMLHYAVHHAKWTNSYFVKLKKHHMAHHFVHPDEGFGVSSTIWDHIFGTTIKNEK
jgi:sterol desaturase/sphingolipid hydroxylase (fatty acid hydroxylase superfamily)